MDLSVVIVNYNTGEYLINCLHSLVGELAAIEAEIFVVDNASTDGSVEALAAAFPQVRVLVNDRNLGFGRANNEALRLARGGDVLLLNPDTLVQPGAVKQLRSALHTLPGAVAVGPKVVRPDGRLDLACRRSFPRPAVALARLSGLSRLFKRNRWLAQYNRTYEDPDRAGEMDAGTAAAMAFRLDAITSIGFFDEAFFMYGEDLDLCFRLKAAGGRIYYVPNAVVTHFKGVSSGQQPRAMLREFHRAMWLFYRKHYAGGWSGAFAPLVFAGIQLRYGFVLAINAVRGRQIVSP